MSNGYVFISHATADDDFVRQLREGLEGQGVTVWVDSRNLRGGDKLSPTSDRLSPKLGSSLWS